MIQFSCISETCRKKAHILFFLLLNSKFNSNNDNDKKSYTLTYHHLYVHTSHQTFLLYNLHCILPLYDCTMSFLYSKRCMFLYSFFQNSQWNTLWKKKSNLLFILFPFQHNHLHEYVFLFFLLTCISI